MKVEAISRGQQWLLLVGCTGALAFSVTIWVVVIASTSIGLWSYFALGEPFDLDKLWAMVGVAFVFTLFGAALVSFTTALLAGVLSVAAHPFVRKLEGATNRRALYMGAFSTPFIVLMTAFSFSWLNSTPIIAVSCLVVCLAGIGGLSWLAAVAIYPARVDTPVAEPVELAAA